MKTWQLLSIAACYVSLTVAQSTVHQNHTAINITDDFHTHEVEFESNYPNVLSVKFHLRHTRIPELLTKISLFEMECPISPCNVSPIDIADAIQLETYDSDVIADAIGKMNITGRDAYNIFLVYNLNASSIQNFLTEVGTTFSEVYKHFVDSLVDPSNSIPRILSLVNVSIADFTNAQVYGNDTTRLEVLANGNYSLENIEAVLNSTNKTGMDLLKTFPLNVIAKNLKKLDQTDFRNLIKNFGVTSTKVLSFYKHLNVTTINFIAYPGFIDMLNGFESFLNPEEVVGTAISPNKLVTSNKAKSVIKFQTDNSDFTRNYSYFQAENIENPLIHYHIKNAVLLNNEYKSGEIAFIDLYNSYKGNILQLSTTYNTSTLTNCTYVTKLPFGEILSEPFGTVNLSNNHVFTLVKSNVTVYNLGSPLFCQNKLVAIATKDIGNEIQYSTFVKKISEVPKPPHQNSTTTPGKVTTPHPTTVSKSDASSRIYSSVVVIFGFFLGSKVFI